MHHDSQRLPRAFGSSFLERILLVALYLVTAGAIAGYAVFGRHPQLLNELPGAVPVYLVAFTGFARGHILLAFAALAYVLVRRAGLRWIGAFAAVYVLSLASELSGTTVGLPFGPYHYTDGLGIKWFGHVPLLIPLSWFFMAVPSFAIALRTLGARAIVAGEPASRRAMAATIALGSAVLLSWDLALDPAMSRVTTYWVWGSEGPYYGMPWLNLFGWYVTGLVLMGAIAALRADRWVRDLPIGWIAAFYGANLLLPVGLAAAAGLWGAVAASLCVAALWGYAALRGESRAPSRAPRLGAMSPRVERS